MRKSRFRVCLTTRAISGAIALSDAVIGHVRPIERAKEPLRKGQARTRSCAR